MYKGHKITYGKDGSSIQYIDLNSGGYNSRYDWYGYKIGCTSSLDDLKKMIDSEIERKEKDKHKYDILNIWED